MFWIELAAILALILANGFFAASEYALISTRKAQISRLIEKGNRRAGIVKRLKSNPDSFVAAIQVGITLVGTLASVVGGATIAERLTLSLSESSVPFLRNFAASISIAIVVVAIVFLTLVIGELVPKRLGMQYAERISLSVARPMALFMKIIFVPVQFLTFTSKLIVRLLKLDRVPERTSITEEEIVQIIADGRKSGEFSEEEHELIASVFEFTERTVRKAMTPRTDISAINIDWHTDMALRFLSEQGRSRYPVFKDTIDNVVGLLYTKDVVHMMCHSELIIVQDILRTPFFVPDSKSLTELLKDFQRKQMHMAIVLDEFGGTAGIITLEDIIEEIVGEIQDEYDTEEVEYRTLSDGSTEISARMSVDDFNKLMGSAIPEDIADSMGGFIFNYLDEIPILNRRIEFDDLIFTVTEKTGNRIDKIRVTRAE